VTYNVNGARGRPNRRGTPRAEHGPPPRRPARD
jgi:hypothetical protein